MINAGSTARLNALGITQEQLAARLAVTRGAVVQALTKQNTRYIALLDALEIMSEEQRRAWLNNSRMPPDIS